MARPRKKTIDYFPHCTRHGKTMFVIEQKFGNDGYAFWFKMLESLGDSEGHYIDVTTPENWEFFVARMGVSHLDAKKIMALFANLGAIDRELWGKHIIWSDNFIDGIEDVYRKRDKDRPKRPDFFEIMRDKKAEAEKKKPPVFRMSNLRQNLVNLAKTKEMSQNVDSILLE